MQLLLRWLMRPRDIAHRQLTADRNGFFFSRFFSLACFLENSETQMNEQRAHSFSLAIQ